ncbi:DUF2515 family protein [Ferviditalea candida]|uniref:DUF2515 family protein n=1 Tax=Ferviditalea candida TaxID=3108399 RepID=A0ABU5ZE34_9BACL|nr:DUF2515 family protein [Paenibacillaceae bacterium T2]
MLHNPMIKPVSYILLKIRQAAEAAHGYILGKRESRLYSAAQNKPIHPLSVTAREKSAIKNLLTGLLSAPASSLRPAVPTLTERNRRICREVEKATLEANRTNVTRTEAYRDIYFRHPELHWALLAHMVSRNGGWNMTDLKGELLPRLLDGRQAESIFRLLERSNSLIFQDAYPQLLLYRESVRSGENLFHLLPQFHVSRFMQPFWSRFWQNRDPVPLTQALIVNEQNYIEGRVVRDPWFRKHVIDTPFFRAQALLQLNQVVFPYYPQETGPRTNGASPMLPPASPRLAGLVLENFADLSERIEFGKKLYAILFALADVHKGVLAFARTTKHTGSRADYWGHLFVPGSLPNPAGPYTERLEHCRLKKHAPKLCSPGLSQAWEERPIDPPERYDWCADLSMLHYIGAGSPPRIFDITYEHCLGWNKIELAVLTEQNS